MYVVIDVSSRRGKGTAETRDTYSTNAPQKEGGENTICYSSSSAWPSVYVTPVGASRIYIESCTGRWENMSRADGMARKT